MGRITLGQAAAWCGGQVNPQYADTVFCGANIDSRSIMPGQLFVALVGARDGHDYIPAAFQKGAAAVLCSRLEGNYPAIVVKDPRIALGDIAREMRRQMEITVVGITGSVGKSTTKEMTACVLESKFRTAKSPANHNNDLGLPMAILALPEDTQVAVLEMGMNHFREMAYLSSVAQPDIAVIVNIGTMHIEHLGSQEGILQAKMEILEGLRPGGKVILNGDDAYLLGAHSDAVYFGTKQKDFYVCADNVQQYTEYLRFMVSAGELRFPVELPLEGAHFVPDALAAVSVALTLGVEPDQITQSLARFQNMTGRQEIFEACGCTIIRDCYNAGPESMAAALHVLGNRPGRHIAVLGDMLELGQRASAEHYRVGKLCASCADLVLTYGPHGTDVVQGACENGMDRSCVQAFDSREELAAALKQRALPGDVILVKGSRGMRMELVLQLFQTET